MVMLALDTCFDGCSVALFGADGRSVLARRFENMQRGHAERMPVMVDEVFREVGVQPSTLTRVAVTRGPGTFTGIRIGLSYAKGLGLALGIPVIGVDSLTAIAVSHVSSLKAVTPAKGGSDKIIAAHAAGATGLFYAAKLDRASFAFIHEPALVGAETLAAWRDDALLVEGKVPDAAVFGAYALTLQNENPQPLYLREADAKPNAPAAFSTMLTRPASLADAALLASLHAESFEQSWTQDMIASSLSLPGAGAIIVELANRAYGFVQFQWVAGEAEINTLCVSTIYRRQGFGRALMEALIAHLKMHNTSKLFLEVAADNAAALALYRKLGFAETGLRKAYYVRKAGAVDAITMGLSL
jgi:tRNA threonylcarbamoyl adenosine modification protein YeaZ